MFARKLIVLMFCATAAGACNPTLAPVLSPVEAVPVIRDAPHSPETTRAAILRALNTKGWKVVKDEAGVIDAHVMAGGHEATVEIQFNADQYAIEHLASSPGLKFDGQRIHRRYNHWVSRLTAQIDKELNQAFAPGEEAASNPALAVSNPAPPPNPATGPSAPPASSLAQESAPVTPTPTPRPSAATSGTPQPAPAATPPPTPQPSAATSGTPQPAPAATPSP